ALNVHRSRLRRAAVALRHGRSRWAASEPAPDPSIGQEVREMLGSLPPSQRAALMLVEWLGYPAEEAAAIPGVRPASVRGRLHRGGGGGPGEGGIRTVGPTLEIYIPSESMAPTLRVGDTVLVDEGAYRDAPPGRGDVVAFRGRDETSSYEFVKRVVGIPGDVV